MDVEIGRDRYEVVEGFFRRPKGWTFVEVADVGVDRDDNVYVFCRGKHPVMIFDKDGHFLDAWGDFSEHYFTFPHGLSVGSDGFVYTADSRDHTVRKWTKDGKHVLTLGSAHQNAPAFSGKPFNRPTHATVAANGDIYVSDGYGNAKIHCFSPDGEPKFSWGARARGPASSTRSTASSSTQPTTPCTPPIASTTGSSCSPLTASTSGSGAACGCRRASARAPTALSTSPSSPTASRCSSRRHGAVAMGRRGRGRRLRDRRRRAGPAGAPSRDPMVRGRVLNEPGAGLFGAPHGIAVDFEGSFYVADASESYVGLDRGSRSIQKFVRL